MNETTQTSSLSRPVRFGLLAAALTLSAGSAVAAQRGVFSAHPSTKPTAATSDLVMAEQVDLATAPTPALADIPAAAPSTVAAPPSTVIRYEDVYVVDPAPADAAGQAVDRTAPPADPASDPAADPATDPAGPQAVSVAYDESSADNEATPAVAHESEREHSPTTHESEDESDD